MLHYIIPRLRFHSHLRQQDFICDALSSVRVSTRSYTIEMYGKSNLSFWMPPTGTSSLLEIASVTGNSSTSKHVHWKHSGLISSTDESGCRIPKKTIREISEFQSLFQLFLGGFLECLESFQMDSMIVRRTVSVNKLKVQKTVGDEHIPLLGSLDVMIFSHSDDEGIVDVCMSNSHIELKSPFGALYHSQSAKEIDQLIAETDCLSAMKAASSVSPSSSGPTIGALTDLFSLNLIYHDENSSSSNNRAFYVTSPVVEPRYYIQQLLVLCMQSADVARLAAASVAENLPFPEEERVEDEKEEEEEEEEEGGCSAHVRPIIIKNDEEDELEEDFEYLRQFEMRRTVVTLTRSNLEALGALR